MKTLRFSFVRAWKSKGFHLILQVIFFLICVVLKRLIISLFIIYLPVPAFPTGKASLDSLDYYLSKQPEYDSLKEQRIALLKEKIAAATGVPDELYSLYVNLYEEYRSYIYDSAYVCVEKLLELSRTLNDPEKMTSSTVKLGFCYLSSGLFKECFDIFHALDVRGCSIETRIDYYFNKSRFYYDLADYNDRPEFRIPYDRMGNRIIDSALLLLPLESAQFWSAVGLKRMKSDNNRGAQEAFQRMIATNNYSEHDLAIATSSIAYLYTLQGKQKEAKTYFIRAAIADIKSSTKETVALRNLAQLLYEEGDIDHSADYIRQALDDASFYNARHRKLEIGYILPIIEKERINLIENQRDRISRFLIFCAVLVVLLLIAFSVIWLQLKHLNRAKQVIQKTNDNLMQANNDLIEANKIKDEYIGYFFNQNSEFIDKLGAFQKWLNQKVAAKQYDDLKNISKNLNVQRERAELYARFDQIFLKMFPDFVKRFNDLLRPDEHILLKKSELLNTDLRIYALMRLGIHDNEKIAQFLGYSVNTIYTSKTKVKNKMRVPYEEFKRKIMKIESK
jgi:tetratricopeptide (TPR) repeat protein